MKNRILRSALSVALCAAMLLSQGLTAFAEGEIDLAAAKSSPVQESSEESEAKTPAETLTPETKKELPASTEDETKTETTTGQPTAEDDTAKETTAKTPAVVSEEEKSEESTAAPAEAQAATNSLEVTCNATKPIPLPSEVIAALPGFSFDCENSNCDASESIDLNDLAFTIGEVNSAEVNSAADTVDITFDNAAFSTSLAKFNAKFNKKCGKHNLAKEEPIVVTLTWNAETDSWYYAGEKRDIIVPVECDKGCHPDPIPEPSITRDEIVEVLGNANATVNVVCTIDGNHIPFKITADSIRVGKWDDSDNSVPFYLSTESYVDEFNLTYPGHTLKNSNDKEIVLWIFYGEDGWTVNFKSLDVEVVCSGTPVEPTDTPEPPSMEKVMELLWDKKVTANCINDDYKKKETYDIQYETIGGLLNPTIKPIEGENGSYSLKLTIAYDPYKDDFEDKYGPHDFADNQTSTSKFYLKWDGLKWSLKDPDSFPGSFNVICDTPSTESLWGWNNGKEVIITCVEENALHTKGMALSLVGVNGDKYWKFDPITWDQEQKCYTTTVTLEPGKYLEVYSGQYGEHALVSDHEDTVLSLKLSYQDGNGKWISNGDKFYLFVECNAPSKPTIEDLDRLFTNTKVNISCKKNKHADKWYPVKDNSVDRLGYLFIGPVEVDDNNHYTAKISLNDAFFISLYNQEEGGDHSLVSKTYITLSYDGEKWVFNDESKLDFDVVVTCPDNDNPGGGEDPGTNPGGGDNGNNGGNNNGGSTGGGSSVSRRDDDDDWEPLPNNNYRVTKKNDKPSQNTQIVVRDPADNSDNTSSNTGSDSGKHNPETGDTTTVFAAMALAAVSLGGVVLLGRKKK